jgi:hypothetical protein
VFRIAKPATGVLDRSVKRPSNHLELVADHLLMAHGFIEQDHAKEMLPVLREALLTAGKLLARNITAPISGDRIH